MTRRIVNGIQMPAWPMRAFKGLVLLVFCAAVIVPFVGVISTSVAPNQQINKSGGLVLLPDSVNFAAYRSLFAGGVVTQALFISMFVTIVGTLLSLTVSCLLAYALARPGFSAGRPILLIVLFSMLFSPGIIPMYLVVKGAGLLTRYRTTAAASRDPDGHPGDLDRADPDRVPVPAAALRQGRPDRRCQRLTSR